MLSEQHRVVPPNNSIWTSEWPSPSRSNFAEQIPPVNHRTAPTIKPHMSWITVMIIRIRHKLKVRLIGRYGVATVLPMSHLGYWLPK